jgi:type VI protein secretion system component VasA
MPVLKMHGPKSSMCCTGHTLVWAVVFEVLCSMRFRVLAHNHFALWCAPAVELFGSDPMLV